MGNDALFGVLTDLKYNEILKTLQSPEAGGKGPASLRVACLRNITIDAIVNYLRYFCLQRGIRADVYMGDFDTALQEAVNPSGPLFSFDPHIIILALKKEVLCGRLINDFIGLTADEVDREAQGMLDHINTILSSIRKNSAAAILVNNFEPVVLPALGILDYQSPQKQVNMVRSLNRRLLELTGRHPGTFIVDMDLLQSRLGYTRFIDTRYWHMGRAPYTREASKLIAFEYAKFVSALRGKQKKCLVLDCDNTLWGGIIGEDGLAGIHLGTTHPGSAYADFQRTILNLYRKGVLLAICSKNNERDVLDVLENHPDMMLRKEHFAAMRINWIDKVANLREIAAELNIGTDSLVFADDNPFEINMIRQLLPEVQTLLLSGEPSDFADLLNVAGYFDTLSFSEEDRRRNEMYQADRERKQAATAGQFEDINDYYRSLEMEIIINKGDPFSVPRISQLTQRTNQFNLTTRRYSEAEIKEMLDDPDVDVRYLRLKDRFGDSGIVGIAILRSRENECEIDTFLLSCRVIGRGVEDVLLKDCELLARKRGCGTLRGAYIPSSKNGQVEAFFPDRGFLLSASPQGGHAYALPLDEKEVSVPDYFKKIERE